MWRSDSENTWIYLHSTQNYHPSLRGEHKGDEVGVRRISYCQLLTLCLLQGFILLVRQIKEMPKLRIIFVLDLRELEF